MALRTVSGLTCAACQRRVLILFPLEDGRDVCGTCRMRPAPPPVGRSLPTGEVLCRAIEGGWRVAVGAPLNRQIRCTLAEDVRFDRVMPGDRVVVSGAVYSRDTGEIVGHEPWASRAKRQA